MAENDVMHYKDWRSGTLTNGIERSAHRALLYISICGSWRSAWHRESGKRAVCRVSFQRSRSATVSARDIRE